MTHFTRALLFLAVASATTPALARDGEVFFRRKGQVEVAPGSRLEVTGCQDADNGGITCSVQLINDSEAPYRIEEEPLTTW